MSRINSALISKALAELDLEKDGFMPPGAEAGPPMDPMAMLGAAGGGGAPPMGPMAMLGGGGGAPLDPSMLGGAPTPPPEAGPSPTPPGAEQKPQGEKGKGGSKGRSSGEGMARIESKIDTLIMLITGNLPPDALANLGQEQQAESGQPGSEGGGQTPSLGAGLAGGMEGAPGAATMNAMGQPNAGIPGMKTGSLKSDRIAAILERLQGRKE